MTIDVGAPVTRSELREELAKFATKIELHEELEKQDQRFDRKLDLWGGALRAEIKQQGGELRAEMKTMRSEIIQEMSWLLQGAVEQFQHSRTVTEPYRDLPARVTRLEAKVFPPKRSRRR